LSIGQCSADQGCLLFGNLESPRNRFVNPQTSTGPSWRVANVLQNHLSLRCGHDRDVAPNPKIDPMQLLDLSALWCLVGLPTKEGNSRDRRRKRFAEIHLGQERTGILPLFELWLHYSLRSFSSSSRWLRYERGQHAEFHRSRAHFKLAYPPD